MTDRDELRRLRDAISAVSELHREGCAGHKRKCPTLVVKGCAHCGVGVDPWPCPTIRALAAAGGVS